MVPKVFLLGRLTKDAILQYTNTGTAITKFSVACNEKFKDEEKSYFYDCQVWGKFAEAITPRLVKGVEIYIEGRLTQVRWQDKDGTGRSKHIITVAECRVFSGAARENTDQPAQTKPAAAVTRPDQDSYFDDDIPF